MAKVIFVDDDEFLLEGLSLSLRKAPFDFYTVSTTAKALEHLEKAEFDIIVSDIHLTGVNGLDFLEECRLRWPDTIRIILSGQIDTASSIKAINEIQVFKILTKPCPPKTLLACLTDALGEYQLVLGRRDLMNIAINHLQGVSNDKKHNDNNTSPHSSDTDKTEPFCGLSQQQIQELSTREKEVLERLLLGYRTPRIAALLHISPHTVRNHLKSIFNKLGVHSQQELIELATCHTYITKNNPY